jgi:hypothetical protein
MRNIGIKFDGVWHIILSVHSRSDKLAAAFPLLSWVGRERGLLGEERWTKTRYERTKSY